MKTILFGILTLAASLHASSIITTVTGYCDAGPVSDPAGLTSVVGSTSSGGCSASYTLGGQPASASTSFSETLNLSDNTVSGTITAVLAANEGETFSCVNLPCTITPIDSSAELDVDSLVTLTTTGAVRQGILTIYSDGCGIIDQASPNGYDFGSFYYTVNGAACSSYPPTMSFLVTIGSGEDISFDLNTFVRSQSIFDQFNGEGSAGAGFTASLYEADGVTPVAFSDVPEAGMIGGTLLGLACLWLRKFVHATRPRAIHNDRYFSVVARASRRAASTIMSTFGTPKTSILSKT